MTVSIIAAITAVFAFVGLQIVADTMGVTSQIGGIVAMGVSILIGIGVSILYNYKRYGQPLQPHKFGEL